MIATAWNLVQRGWLRYTIWETEGYLRACERDGLVDSLSLTDFRAQLEAQRVELAALQPRRAPAAPGRADGAPCAAEACTEVGADMLTITSLAPRRSLLLALAFTVIAAGMAVMP
jgi:hypothetical protein